MEPLALILMVLGAVLVVIGSIWLLIAAFCVSIWWGLASIFLPFASLVFVIMHWARARIPFLISLVGGALAVGALFASPTMRESIKAGAGGAMPEMAAEQKAEEEKLAAQIQQKRDQIELGERQYREDSAKLIHQFQDLQARRASLKPGDNTTIAAFNTEAAAYQQKTAALKQLRAKVDADQLELTSLLDQRARQQPGAPPATNPTAKRVVMYTTSTCPACKAAKDYMARRGIRYEEHDVERSTEARREFDRLGGRGVPLILVGDERMEGFSSQRLDQLL